MISETIKHTNQFMNQLLASDYFDHFLVNSITVNTFSNYQIDGHIKKDFFSTEEWEQLESHTYASYAVLRPICYQLVKGKKLPLSLKIIFALNEKEKNQLLTASDSPLSPEDIRDLFINIKYDHGSVTYTTGTSYHIFTMDKTLEQTFDRYVMQLMEVFS